MSEPFLILHKVRGEAAFDIAIQMEVEDETWWIIPTSGHRAYPHRHWPLSELADTGDINKHGYNDHPYYMDEIPDDLPDHYTVNAEPFHETKRGREILSKLNLLKPVTLTDRRF